MRTPALFAAATIALLGCSPEDSALPAEPLFAAGGSGPTDPTASWLIPLADAGLALRSDGLFGDGTNSVYANGVCGTETRIFATTAGSNSGDATIKTKAPKGRSCGRIFRLSYPDGGSDAVASFNNLRQLQNTVLVIPIGAMVRRTFAINPGALANNPSRCGRLVFGPNGAVAPGSDSVEVTRVDARTWRVQTQAAPNDRAYCENNGQLYPMPVNLVIVSSANLP